MKVRITLTTIMAALCIALLIFESSRCGNHSWIYISAIAGIAFLYFNFLLLWLKCDESLFVIKVLEDREKKEMNALHSTTKAASNKAEWLFQSLRGES